MAGHPEPFDLQRFVDAQAGVYDTVVAELRGGRKRSHWMWFVFPQLAGLGLSATAQRYGIANLGEARAYLAHELLGPRLHECARLLTAVRGRSMGEVLGSPDDLKLRSSMTLFVRACGHREEGYCRDCADFGAVLDRYYGGQQDPRTLDLLARLGESVEPRR